MKNKVSSFSIERTLLFSKRYLYVNKKMIVSGFFIMLGIIALFIIPTTLMPNKELFNDVQNNYVLTIITYFGFGLASAMFNELNSKEKAPQYLTLPVSSLEKLVSAWLISYVGFLMVGLTLLLLLITIMGNDVSNYMDIFSLNQFLSFTFFHSVFLFGAIFFKVNNFLSTLLSIVGLVFLVGILFFLKDYFFPASNSGALAFSDNFQLSILNYNAILKTIVITGISALFIYGTYNRLKNRQLS